MFLLDYKEEKKGISVTNILDVLWFSSFIFLVFSDGRKTCGVFCALFTGVEVELKRLKGMKEAFRSYWLW